MNRPGRRIPVCALAMGCGVLVSLGRPESGDDGPSADAILQSKGLCRAGALYILPEDADLGVRVERLRTSFEGWKRDRARLAEELKALDRLHRQYGQALRTIMKLSLPNHMTSSDDPAPPERRDTADEPSRDRRRKSDAERQPRRKELGFYSRSPRERSHDR